MYRERPLVPCANIGTALLRFASVLARPPDCLWSRTGRKKYDPGRATASTGGSRGSHFRRALGGKARAVDIDRTLNPDTVLSNAA